MKHLKLSLIPLGVILAFSGCTHVVNVPQIPTLIVPEDPAVFEAEPPTFIWTSDSLFLADAYIIIILKDSLRSEDTLVYETLEDTTYTMPQDIFNSADSGTYCWVAVVHWIDGNVETTAHGDPRTFVIKKPEEPQGLDLDTTYFPFGLGYKWCYESNNGGVYDTFTVEVTDSSWIADTLVFQLIGSFYGISNPVEIWDNQVTVFDELIDVVPQACTLINEPLKFYVISYRSDILWITVYYPWGEDPDGFAECWTTHERGIGARKQERTNWSGGGPVSGFTYTLLTMTTPEGQRYP
ncbi:hypothetical protein KAX21_01410 [candidate division WOR-3 bacterium]|nr:hypothetical protein [candidate division WOR-3 bacterium]